MKQNISLATYIYEPSNVTQMAPNNNIGQTINGWRKELCIMHFYNRIDQN